MNWFGLHLYLLRMSLAWTSPFPGQPHIHQMVRSTTWVNKTHFYIPIDYRCPAPKRRLIPADLDKRTIRVRTIPSLSSFAWSNHSLPRFRGLAVDWSEGEERLHSACNMIGVSGFGLWTNSYVYPDSEREAVFYLEMFDKSSSLTEPSPSRCKSS